MHFGHQEFKENFYNTTLASNIILGVGKTCPIAGPFSDTGWVPLSHTIKFSILSFRLRVLGMGHDWLPYKMYAWSMSIARGRVKSPLQNWVAKTILEKYCRPSRWPNEVWDALAKRKLATRMETASAQMK